MGNRLDDFAVIWAAREQQRQREANGNGHKPEPKIVELPDLGQRLTKIGLMVVFGGAALLFSRKRKIEPMGVFDWFTLALAVTRLGRMTEFDGVTEPLRSVVAVTVKHEHYGEVTAPKFKSGPLASFGQLVTCRICAGTWWAAALTYGLSLFPNMTKVFVRIQALAGAVEVIDSVIEAGCWIAAAARRFTGKGL